MSLGWVSAQVQSLGDKSIKIIELAVNYWDYKK